MSINPEWFKNIPLSASTFGLVEYGNFGIAFECFRHYLSLRSGDAKILVWQWEP